MNEVDLISLLCSRLCHDLVGPIAAIGNGVEVMEEEDDPDMQKQALELLAHSADLAAKRLKFFRLAFGSAGGEGVPISLREARATAQDFLAGGRTTLAWPDESIMLEDGLPKTGVKLLLNLIIIAAEGMPRGGTVGVQIAEGPVVRIESHGTGARLGDAVQSALRTGKHAEGIDPKTSPSWLAALLAHSLGWSISIERAEDRFSLTAAA